MKKFIFGTIVSLGLVSIVVADDTNLLSDKNWRVSYALGVLTGHAWQQQGVDFDVDAYARGIKEAKSGSPTLLTPEQAQQAVNAFRMEFMAEQQKKRAEEGVKNKADGAAFLAANKNNPGVVTLPDGLQYVVVTNGSGAIPTATDVVSVNYRGTLIDGTEFDSSYKRGQPVQFPVVGVIRGWTEALEKMPVGSKWKLFIPSDLAYGEQGNRSIPPNATLIFDVELLEIKSSAPPVAAPATPVQPLTSDIIKVPSAEEMKHGAKIEVIKPDDATKAASGGK
jgi:FKBP-type peptidyl-prolyl cis-trans isomerase FklB